jgi:hypothetical protein
MARDVSLEEFAHEVRQDLISSANLEGEETSLPWALTQRFIDDLSEVAELDGGEVAYAKGHGYQANGYALADDGGRLDLFYTSFGAVPPRTVTRAELETGFSRLRAFYERARRNLYLDLEESSPEWDMAQRISELQELRRLRLYIFTDGLTTLEEKPNEQLDGVTISHHVWDLRRLYRADPAGRQPEPIDIDLVAWFGRAIPCLVTPSPSPDYTAYLAIFPGQLLSAIYEEFGGRLLERNVRAFLQARGKVNKGLQETLTKEPERFLAYNNGISATASEVEIVPMPGGGRGIARMRDFQIVNGGQTTASIHYAEHKSRTPLDDVYVQAKLTVVDATELGRIVPLISRYANSQNKVNEADFAANEPFHVAVEKLSRTVWAPALEGSQRQTRWFYERARGQYQDALSRVATPALRREFQRRHPPSQRFSKTDLAKFENTWDQFPQVVSLGAEKNFQQFTTRLADRAGFRVTPEYYQKLVAKAILFRKSDARIAKIGYGGYKANIVTYTLAYVSWVTDQQLNLDEIWLTQEVPSTVLEVIAEFSDPVRTVLLDAPGNGNITEWCKKPACWDAVRSVGLGSPRSLAPYLLDEDPENWRVAEQVIEVLRRAPSPIGKAEILTAAGISDSAWPAAVRTLLDQGRVVREGERRGAVYRLPD